MCYVYVIASKSAVKIGVTTNVESRLNSLQTANSEQLTIIAVMQCADSAYARDLERKLHDRYRAFAVRGEWFELKPDFVVEDIKFALTVAGLIETFDFRVIKGDPPLPRVIAPYRMIAAVILTSVILILIANLLADGVLPLSAILTLGIQALASLYYIK